MYDCYIDGSIKNRREIFKIYMKNVGLVRGSGFVF